jgi:hypothetical protein
VKNLAVITKRESTETIRPADRFPGDFRRDKTKRESTETIRPADRFPGDFRRDKTKTITNHFPLFPKLYINALSKCRLSPDH